MSTSDRATYHHGDLRNALLDAGSAVAHELGAEALSLREVARRAGVSHTAAYNHFADKNDLLRGLAVRAFEQLAEELQAAADAPDASLENSAAAYIRFAMSHSAEFRFMFQRSLCMPDGEFDPLAGAGMVAQDVLRGQILLLQANGELVAGNPEDLVLAAWSQVHGITTIVLETPVFKSVSVEVAEHLARQGMRALIDGIGARE